MEKTKTFENYTVIIPTLNEEKNIGDLINLILKLYPKINIIISDDGSVDSTKKIVENLKKNIIFLDRKNKKIKGLAISVIDAIKISKTKYIVVMDADFQHPPEKIIDILNNLNTYDLVIAIRKNIKEINLFRRLISNFANSIAKIKLIIKNKNFSKDPLSGFFGIKKEIILNSIIKNNNKYELKGYKILFDFLKSYNKKIKIKEIMFNFAKRKKNVSKLNKWHIFYFLRSFLK